jgi:molecular chaperone Hsp33
MTATNDVLNRFLFDHQHVRGELVQLQHSVQQILQNHHYPAGVQQLLAELLAATCLLTATIKFEGDITVQLQGDGPVGYMAVNGNNQQQMRGIARVTEGAANGQGLNELIGNGKMIITIRPTQGEAYQGVVALTEATIADCLTHYFDVSEQIPTKIWLYTDSQQQKVAGALLQLLPDSDNKQQQLDDFEHFCQLTHTIKASEIFSLSAEQLLHRLYHQAQVRLFEAQDVSYLCGCSEQKCLNAISQMHTEEISAILDEQGSINMTCDYCLTEYVFDANKLQTLLNVTKH